MRPEELASALLTGVVEREGRYVFAGEVPAAVNVVTATEPAPLPTVEELLATVEEFKSRQRESDLLMVRALVDLVNRSPKHMTPGYWAERLGVPLPKFVNTCHEDEEVDGDFRDRVYDFFHRLTSGRERAW